MNFQPLKKLKWLIISNKKIYFGDVGPLLTKLRENSSL